MQVIIVQHGQKEPGAGDPGLSAIGRRQAETTAEALGGSGVVGVWTSPLCRAVETAAPIADRLGVTVTTDGRLRERMNYDDSVWRSLEEFLGEWELASTDRSYVPRHGDSSFQAGRRLLDALEDITAAASAGTAVVVAHGGVTTDALRTLVGDELLTTRAPRLIGEGPAPGALTTLDRSGGGWTVVSIATTDHLAGT